MQIEALLRAAHILRAQPGCTMPLSRLHARLEAELGPVGSYADMYRQLKKQAESFLILDTPRVLGGTDSWPGLVRESYDSAMGEAGLGSCVRVTLTELPANDAASEIVAALGATMGNLMGGPEEDPALREFAQRAAQQLAEVSRAIMSAAADRPTTPPPDPPLAR